MGATALECVPTLEVIGGHMAVDSAANRLGFSTRKVHRLINTGRLPGQKVFGIKVVSEDAVERWAQQAL